MAQNFIRLHIPDLQTQGTTENGQFFFRRPASTLVSQKVWVRIKLMLPSQEVQETLVVMDEPRRGSVSHSVVFLRGIQISCKDLIFLLMNPDSNLGWHVGRVISPYLDSGVSWACKMNSGTGSGCCLSTRWSFHIASQPKRSQN